MFDDIIGNDYCEKEKWRKDSDCGCECLPPPGAEGHQPPPPPCNNSCENEPECKSSCSGCAGTSKP